MEGKDMDSLFDMTSEEQVSYAPLADRMRPRRLDEIMGQEAAIGRQSFLYRMIEKDTIPSLLLFGPPGCGKTTIASVIAEMTKSRFVKVNATSSGIKDIRDVVVKAKEELSYYRRRTIVFIDEIHRFNKGQQDVLLPYVEDGTFILIGATTENPYFEINGPLLSRMRLIHLKALTDESIIAVLRRALADEKRGLGIHHYGATEDALSLISSYASGDTRVALNLLEQSCAMLSDGGTLTPKEIAEVAGERTAAYDKNRDYHYNIISAFIKSMRGSDPDAALHYLARMIDGGEKPSFISRRIMICAAEDVGLADPRALQVAVAAAQAAEMVGFPEAQIILAEAVLYVCLAPKSNSACAGIFAAEGEEKTRSNWSIPLHLMDAHYGGAKKMGIGVDYKYPHDFGGWVAQQYLPDELVGHTYYHPRPLGEEGNLVRAWWERKNRK